MKTMHTFDREEIMAYVDGELTRERVAVVRAHLDECAACRALVDDLRGLSGQLAVWQPETSPVRLASLVGRAAATAAAKPDARGPISRWLSGRSRLGIRRWALIATPALAVLALVVAIPMSVTLPSRAVLGSAREAPADRTAGVRAGTAGAQAQERGAHVAGQTPQGPPLTMTIQTEPEAVVGPMVVRTASMQLSTDKFDDMRLAIERLVAAHDGRIGSLEVSGDPASGRSLNATLRVPVAKLDAALAGLRQLGKITAESQSSEEVTDSYRDLRVRIANGRREEQRLVELLAKRTGDLADVLAVEQALARVRGEVERMEASERAMKNRVDFATVSVVVRENYRADLALGPQPFGTQLRNAFVDGLRTAAEHVVNVALTLLAAGPTVFVWVLILAWPARKVWKRLRSVSV
jgi:hypothetical protein